MKTSLIRWDAPGNRSASDEVLEKGEPKHHLKNWLMARRSSIVDWFAPIGYQDEEGFHYGEQRVPGHTTDGRSG
jgi:hypothetical protein